MTDPLQRLIGLHRRRLLRVIGALEDVLCGDGEGRFPLRDHYVARLIDFLDLSATLLRTVARDALRAVAAIANDQL